MEAARVNIFGGREGTAGTRLGASGSGRRVNLSNTCTVQLTASGGLGRPARAPDLSSTLLLRLFSGLQLRVLQSLRNYEDLALLAEFLL